MEADAIMNMVEYAFYQCCFIIDVMVSDDKTTIKYVLNNQSRAAQGHAIKPPKGKLDE